jgi:hypothetical protein
LIISSKEFEKILYKPKEFCILEVFQDFRKQKGNKVQEGCCTPCLFQNSLKKAAARPESQPQAKTMSAFFYCLKTGASTRLRNCVPLSEGSIVACGNFSDCKLLLNIHCIRYLLFE